MFERRLFLKIMCFLFFAPLVAAHSEYMLIIDAGSSGSRGYLYQYTMSNDFKVTELFSKKVTPGLSSYEKEPVKVAEGLTEMMQQACKQVPKDSKMKVQVLATAGMRLLTSTQQNKIYTALKTSIESKKGQCPLVLVRMQTIPGKMEGIYSWLSINYTMGNVTGNTPLVGVADIGGASAQITFPTKEKVPAVDSLVMTIRGTPITIFSKSFLGLGQDAARRDILNLPFAASCFQSGYWLENNQEGHFNFQRCTSVYKHVVDRYKLDSLLKHDNLAFVLADGAPQIILGSFQAIADPNPATTQYNINTACREPFGTRLWTDPFLGFDATRCANGTYLTYLIYNGFKLDPYKLTIASTIHDQPMHWPLGVLVYEWLNGGKHVAGRVPLAK